MLFFLKDNKKEFILWLNVPKVTAYGCLSFLSTFDVEYFYIKVVSVVVTILSVV